jgi:hypothetical protein
VLTGAGPATIPINPKVSMIRKLSFLAALSLSAACGGSQPAPTSQPTETVEAPVEEVVEAAPANVRFVHASPAAPIRVRANDESVSEEPLMPGTWTTTRVAVASGDTALAVVPSGGGEVFASANASLEAEGNYTLFFIGNDTMPGPGSGPSVLVVEDDLSAPDGANAKVRFVHAVSGGESVSISAPSGRGYAAGLDFGFASAFYSVAPSSNSFTVSAGGEELATVDLPLTGGLLYTVVFVAEADGVGTLVVSESAE